MVIFNQVTGKKDFGFYRKKLKKVFKIGVWGTWNGIRMRKWYNEDVHEMLELKDVELVCQQLKIPFRAVHGINTEETANLFREANAELGLSLGNSYIGKRIFSIPKYGMINIHGELLPQFKNAQSVIWQLYQGNINTGYTIHEINSKIDDGAILRREEVPIIFKSSLAQTVTSTCAEILRRAAAGLLDILDNFAEYRNKKSTPGAGTSYTTPSYRQFLAIRRNFENLKKKQSTSQSN